MSNCLLLCQDILGVTSCVGMLNVNLGGSVFWCAGEGSGRLCLLYCFYIGYVCYPNLFSLEDRLFD